MMVLAARFVDRVGKGVRGAPRDALVADITPDAVRGGAYGLRQALDTAGAFIGPLTAIGLMALFADNMRAVFWLAAIPGAIAVILVVMGVEERAVGAEKARERPPIRFADLRKFDLAFWGVVCVGVVFTLARFSEAFLVLKASAEGLPLALAPLVYVVMNAVFSIGAYPAGLWSDRVSPATLLLGALAALILADLVFVLIAGLVGVFAGIMLWGVYLALTQGLLAKLVADYAPPDLRGSAFGVFNLATGVATLAASTIAGLVWTQIGSNATFIVGAGLAAAAGVLVAVLARRSFRKTA
jgi:MFS family permease